MGGWRGGLYDSWWQARWRSPSSSASARAALAEGDTDLARTHIAAAVETLDTSQAEGKTRLTIAAGILIGLLVLITGLTILLRRRRRRKRAAASSHRDLGPNDPGPNYLRGGVGDVSTHGDIDLDENALAGASVSSVHDTGNVSGTDPSEAAGAARIVQSDPILSDVGNPILKLNEHIGAVIDTDPVAGAEVLVDPDAHDGQEP